MSVRGAATHAQSDLEKIVKGIDQGTETLRKKREELARCKKELEECKKELAQCNKNYDKLLVDHNTKMSEHRDEVRFRYENEIRWLEQEAICKRMISDLGYVNKGTLVDNVTYLVNKYKQLLDEKQATSVKGIAKEIAKEVANELHAKR